MGVQRGRTMTRRERVYAAIRHEEPDKVPKGEIGVGIADKLVRDLLGGEYDMSGDEEAKFQNQRKVRELLGIDLITVDLDGPPAEKVGVDPQGHDILRDFWGREQIITEIGAPKTYKPVLSDIEEVYSFETPSLELFDAHTIERWVRETDFFIFPVVAGSFEYSFELLRFEDFMIWCHNNKKEIEIWTEKITRFGAECARRMVQAGAHGIVIADDMAYKSGTMISPDLLREIIFPYLAQEAVEIKKLGVPVFLHTDGDINAIMDDIVQMGFDGIQAIQPSANMDIAQVKEKYGDCLCLMGNIDIYLLGRGSPEQVVEEVKRVIDIAAPGEGLSLAAAMSWDWRPLRPMLWSCIEQRRNMGNIEGEGIQKVRDKKV